MRILVVEDEIEIADGIKEILKHSGYEVDTVYDGESGLDYILGGIYDLVLLDYMLPKMDGISILKQVRAEGIDVQIIMLTAKSTSGDKIEGLDAGADDYLTKPFDAGELLARIRTRLRSSNKIILDGRLRAFDISLEQASYKLYGQSKSVQLSNKEYQLMEYLMLNKNIIVSKDMIENKVWGVDNENDYNSLEVYISFIRKKMKFVDANCLIVTKKGVGYVLMEVVDD